MFSVAVCDDNSYDLSTMTAYLSELRPSGINAEVATYSSGAELAAAYNKGRRFHCIVLDMLMTPLDGISTAREIRKSMGEDVPILLISAYDWSEIEENARGAGVTGFISKPLFKSTLYYGLKPYAEEDEVVEAAEENIDLTGRKILLAEDNDLNWEIANELLSELGMELEHAENGQLCVEMFQNSPIGYYDAVLMDIRMPVMTGYEAAWGIRRLEREDSDIPIIAMTADAFSEDIKRCLDCGMNAHIAKPIDVREVSRILEKFIKGR